VAACHRFRQVTAAVRQCKLAPLNRRAGHATQGTGTGPRREDLETGTQSALKVARSRLHGSTRG
jgi:hypothetical protein